MNSTLQKLYLNKMYFLSNFIILNQVRQTDGHDKTFSGATVTVPQFLIMNYGRNYRFKQITLILLNRATHPNMEAYEVDFMNGVEVSLLDDNYNKVHFCDTLETHPVRFDEINDQTYVVSCHSGVGQKVRLETNKESPMKRAILVVDTWAEVEVIFPGTVNDREHQ
jgi:cytidylate kinase